MDNTKIALLDGDMVCFVIAVIKKQTEEQIAEYGDQTLRTLEDCKKELDNYLYKIISNSNSTHFIGFLTSKSFRYSVDPEYKANRKNKEIPEFLNDLKQYCIDKYKFVKIEGYEADDLMAVYQTHSKVPTVIVSTDKDMKQIKGEHYNPRKNEHLIVTHDEAERNLWSQVLLCDPVDNIRKSFKFGPKGIELLFKDVVDSNEYKHLAFEVYTSKLGLEKGIDEFNRNFKLIYLTRPFHLFNEDLLLNYKLMDFFPDIEEIDRNSEREQGNSTQHKFTEL